LRTQTGKQQGRWLIGLIRFPMHPGSDYRRLAPSHFEHGFLPCQF
jgi:hypothetical protein